MRAFLPPPLRSAGTWDPFHTCQVLPLMSTIQEDCGWFILCHNICLHELSYTVGVVLSLLRKIIPSLNRTEDFQRGDCAKKWP